MRIRGLIIDNYAPTPLSRRLRHLQRFGDGESFGPLRQYIRSLTLETRGIVRLPRLIGPLSQFTDIKSVTIYTTKYEGVEKNLYVATLSLLSKLPFYHNIEHMVFDWRQYYGDSWSGDSDVAAEDFVDPRIPSPDALDAATFRLHRISDPEITDSDHPYQGLGPVETGQRDIFLEQQYKWPWNKSDILGRFISERAFGRLVTTKKVNLPRKLHYLKVAMENYRPCFCLPLIHCQNLVALYLGTEQLEFITKKIIDPRRPNQMVQLPTVKFLTLSFPEYHLSDYRDAQSIYEDWDDLAVQFPNLTLLCVLMFEMGETYWIDVIPNFEHLESLLIPWSLDDYWDTTFVSTKDVERSLIKRLDKGEFGNLKKLTLSKRYEDFREAICVISRPAGPNNESTLPNLDWVRDGTNFELLRSILLDDMWSSGKLRKTGFEKIDEPGSVAEESDWEGSVFDSEDERIEVDKGLTIRAKEREKSAKIGRRNP
ncbi:hypothetical protein TWF730_007021 [Orbilia blumenaviensis]|uniref:Uncharacterized protein n=1 Tax=Orbilia blumenaviensis TaxID=1796055 RepID=A0AAV9VIY1_9PEZI